MREFDAAATVYADRTTALGAGIAGLGYLSASELAAIIGAIVALGGLLVSWYYKRAANSRLTREHELHMQEQQLRIELLRSKQREAPHENKAPDIPAEADE